MSADGDVPAECTPEDVEVVVTWQDEQGRLTGSVAVRNTSGHACRVSGKPAVIPLEPDGTPLDVRTLVTLELRRPGYVVLQPGDRAEAPLSWGAWNGPEPGEQAIVVWGRDRNRTRVTVTGPRRPASRGEPTNVSSSWFRITR